MRLARQVRRESSTCCFTRFRECPIQKARGHEGFAHHDRKFQDYHGENVGHIRDRLRYLTGVACSADRSGEGLGYTPSESYDSHLQAKP